MIDSCDVTWLIAVTNVRHKHEENYPNARQTGNVKISNKPFLGALKLARFMAEQKMSPV